MSNAPSLGIPPLAGVCTYEQASQVGYDVDTNVELMRRYNYVETRLVQLYSLRLTATPEWEVKGAFSLHMWLDAEHSRALRTRAHELRHPPLFLDNVPDARLKALMDEVLCAADTLELLVGVYRVVKPALVSSCERHLAETNPLVDQPTRRLLRFNVMEEEEAAAWGEQAIAALATSADAIERANRWQEHLHAFLVAAGGIHGSADVPADHALPPARFLDKPFVPSFVPQRDSRFQESFNFNFPPFEVSGDAERDPRERTLALMCRRLLEMDVPEMMASILAETEGKPWDYYADMARQVWDEARHSMLGEAYFASKSVDWTQIPLPLHFPLSLNLMREPQVRHAVLFAIEHGLMRPDTGKKSEREVARLSGDQLAALYQDYDWADEVLHKNIGLRWLKGDLQDVKNILALAESEHRPEEVASMQQRYAEETGTPQREWWQEFADEVLGPGVAKPFQTQRSVAAPMFVKA